MLFEELFRAWKQKGLLSKALDELKVMVDKDKAMFKEASHVLFQGKKTEMDFYEEDKKVNQHEMNIRRMILEHLAINPGRDANAFLILIIANKDLERIGDYCKNMIELAYLYKNPLEGSKYVAALIKIQERLEQMFELTEKAFFKTDERTGKLVMDKHKEMALELDKMIEEIMNDKKIDSKKAVACALLARWFKRVSSHLKNTARMVVNPFDKMNEKAKPDIGKNVPAWKAG